MPKRFLISTVFITVLQGVPAGWAAAVPPAGVYSCYDVRMDYQMHMIITPMPFVMFGLIDATTYSDFDGHHGRYTYAAAAGMLTMTDGPRQGWRYHKVAEWSFSLIDNNTGKEIYTCPFDAGKNPARGPW
jgi:hypothetical protein